MFKRIEFIFAWCLLQSFRFMPFFMLYAVSWWFYLLIYHVFRYRRSVVYDNLSKSFPEKAEAELKITARKFYRNFCDVLAETMKGITMSENSLKKRFRVLNPGLMNELYEQKKSVISIGAHYCNTEWGKILGRQLKHPMIVIYSPFTNKYSDHYYNRSRVKFGMKLVPVAKTLRAFNELRGDPHCFLMGVDQRPFVKSSPHWQHFLHQETAFHKGYEQIARKFNIPVVYSDIQRVKRGYYTLEYLMLSPEPSKSREGEIVDKFIYTLEKIIRNKPEDWLWSHKRWKYTRDQY